MIPITYYDNFGNEQVVYLPDVDGAEDYYGI